MLKNQVFKIFQKSINFPCLMKFTHVQTQQKWNQRLSSKEVI